jgi:tRNA nucleotidyltransferase/poly(A) polymerase
MARAADPARARTAAQEIVAQLRSAGHVAFFAGGCVRDELLGLSPTDYDVATDATPDRIRALFPRSDAVGAAFGVVLVHVGQSPGRVTVEVATFRADGPYTDARRPDSIVFSDPATDAQRRDFTVNALFLDPLAGIDEPSPLATGDARSTHAPVRGRVIDYVGGLADLHDRVIRAVGDPEHRLAEDHLRALRAVRFTARLGFALDPRTAAAIRWHASDLRGVSRERIGDEVRRMLGHPARGAAADLLAALTLDAAIYDQVGSPASHPRLAALAKVRAEPVPLGLTLAAWIVDRVNPAPEAPFAPPKPLRQAIVAGVRKALCLSNDESDALASVLAGLEAIRTGWLHEPVARQKRAAAKLGFADAVDLIRAEELAGVGGSGSVWVSAARVHARLEELAQTPGGIAPVPLVTGDDLLALGAAPGPKFKAILDRLYDEQLEGRVLSREQGMELARAWCV